jgi:hypothetical protein
MSLLSRLKGLFSDPPSIEPGASPSEPLSRHDRREAGRDRHHQTGEPAWEASDRIDQPGASERNPDAAPEILGGN